MPGYYIPTYSAERTYNNGTPVAMSTPYVQTLDSKYHSVLKGIGTLWNNS